MNKQHHQRRTPFKKLSHSASRNTKKFQSYLKTLSFRKVLWKIISRGFLFGVVALLVVGGIFILWIATLSLPDLDNFADRKISSSTKIYDKTGEIVLFDIHENIERILVDSDHISPYMKNAIIAIEDQKFYQHPGVDVQATLRAVIFTILSKLNIRDVSVQGGSTITQQILKNTLLTKQRKVSRKIKEWFLAIKLEQVLTKDEILEQYLNEIPFGGSMYGVEQAAQSFFGVTSQNITLAEAAYLASIPNAPTYYSPYGNNIDALENRKNKVLLNMKNFGYITETEYLEARAEEVEFRLEEELDSKALHFVQYIREQLEKTYGKDVVENEGLQVITSLDYELQKKAEDIALENALENETLYNASNQAIIVLDPTTGQILSMVGSRDFNDKTVEGKFNVTLAKRQPGSSIKPFIYAEAFRQGYTDSSILFDVRTQFQESCSIDLMSSTGECYSPINYDNQELGPLSLRNALAQSRNIVAVKLLYLVGIRNSISLMNTMGIASLNKPDRYGLTLVLGGGEVSLLEMASAYGVFADDGIRNEPVSILSITDRDGNNLYAWQPNPRKVIDSDVARRVSSILSDNEARTPLFGARSFLYFGENASVAGKTGTTNNNKDAWLIGYSPSVVVAVWSGNNDNTPMKKGSSISGPSWRAVMDEALKLYPPSNAFFSPKQITTGKPFIDGIWLGGEQFEIDSISGKLATELTPIETKQVRVIPEIHSALHWITRGDPLGPTPTQKSSLYKHWEYAVDRWIHEKGYTILNNITIVKPEGFDDVHTLENIPKITTKTSSLSLSESSITLDFSIKANYSLKSIEYYIDGVFMGEIPTQNPILTLQPSKLGVREGSVLRVDVIDEVYNRGSIELTFKP